MYTASKRRLDPELERRRHRLFDMFVLPVLALITLFLIWKAMLG